MLHMARLAFPKLSISDVDRAGSGPAVSEEPKKYPVSDRIFCAYEGTDSAI
jgi:hypothetical protein